MEATTDPSSVNVTGFMLVHAACALIAGVPAVAIVRRVALSKGWMAKPREDRWHREPVALHGGVFGLALLLLWWRDHAAVTHWPIPARRRSA